MAMRNRLLRREHNPLQLRCGFPGCQRWFKSTAGRKQHIYSQHAPYLALHSQPATLGARDNPTEGNILCDDSSTSGVDDVNDLNNLDDHRSQSEINVDNWLDLLPPADSLNNPASDVEMDELPNDLQTVNDPPSDLAENEHNEAANKKTRTKICHPLLNGVPCTEDGTALPLGMPPPPNVNKAQNDWTPFRNGIEFRLAEFLFCKNEMPAGNIDTLMDLWAATLLPHNDVPPFANHKDLYKTIDSIPLGDVPWQTFNVKYDAEDLPQDGPIPPWMTASYEVWFRDPHAVMKNLIGNPDYKGCFDTAPVRVFDKDGKREYQNFMSGDWAWDEADKIAAENPANHGAMLVPIILGSDKTTVSVATGQNEYYPLYASIGSVHNNVRRAHRGAVVLIGFLAIPKTDKVHADEYRFRKFRRQLFHSSISMILRNLRPGMTTPEVVRCFDNHFRRVIYSIGPYIADYPEQALLANIVQGWCPRCTANARNLDDPNGGSRSREHTEVLVEELEFGTLWEEYGLVGDIVPFTNDFPRADIHKLIAPDILHQLIKGVFKDHLVTWVERYIRQTHDKSEANKILRDIDRRIAAAPPFSGLRRFSQGRNFKQWTGDDSKALMKVYLPAIEGHVPRAILRTLRAFLEFCYIARHNVITERMLDALKDALERFYSYREVFKDLGVCDGFSLPRQHSMKHYLALIRLFGAPNGVCSSITESKHIVAVKRPWRRSNRFKALGQMLLTNQRLDKLAAARVHFTECGMLDRTALAEAMEMIKSARIRNNLQSDGLDVDDLDDESAGNADDDVNNNNDDDANNNNDDDANNNNDDDVNNKNDEVDEVSDEPTVLAHVDLARTIVRKCTPATLAIEIGQREFPDLLRRFLYDQLYPNSRLPSTDVSLNACPLFSGLISIHNSAVATYYAPSDPSGINGMHREHIRSTPSWRKGTARFDCAFVEARPDTEIMSGLDVVRILLFFSFDFQDKTYPCALVQWYTFVGQECDPDTGMWMVEPHMWEDGSRYVSVIHLDCIFRAAHLLAIYDETFIPETITYGTSLDAFQTYYVNKYADHHAFEIAT